MEPMGRCYWKEALEGTRVLRASSLLSVPPIRARYLSGIMGEPKVNLFHNIRII